MNAFLRSAVMKAALVAGYLAIGGVSYLLTKGYVMEFVQSDKSAVMLSGMMVLCWPVMLAVLAIMFLMGPIVSTIFSIGYPNLAAVMVAMGILLFTGSLLLHLNNIRKAILKSRFMHWLADQSHEEVSLSEKLDHQKPEETIHHSGSSMSLIRVTQQTTEC